VKRAVACAEEIVVELLDAGFVRHRWVGKRARAGRLRRILALVAVDQVEPLGLGVVRLEVAVGDGPGWGDAAVVLDLLEVALAQAEQDPAVDLGVAANEVVGVRAERDPVLVIPPFGGDIALVVEDLARVPVLALARQVAAALEQQDLLARRCESVGERPAARAGADDYEVVVVHRFG
jgi:hypothetical protein